MASLRVKDQGGGPFIYARWRARREDGTRGYVERPLGPGWLVADGKPGAKNNGRTIGTWRERAGNASDGFLTPETARELVPNVIAAWEAEQERKATVRARDQGEGLTMAELGDRYLAWGGRDDPHADRDAWKHSHALNMRAYVARIVREVGEDRAADAITETELRRFLRSLTPIRNGKPTGAAPSRKFLSNYAVPLKSMFALAHRSGWIEADPAAALPTYKPKRKRAADPLRRDEYLTPEEVRAVLDKLTGEQDRAMLLTMAMAGLRPGEALALRWQDVDLTGSTLRIVEARTMGVTDVPKSGSGRSVPMPPEVAQVLAAIGLRDAYTSPGDRVFMGRGDDTHVSLDGLRDRFNAAQDDAKVYPRRELRQLRNTFATTVASGGVPLRTLQEWLGHESITTTERYASFMPRDRDAAMVSAAFAVETIDGAAAQVDA